MPDIARKIEEADGLTFLGLYLEAWEVLESIPAKDRVLPGVLAVRALICAGLERWEMGREIARCIGQSQPLPYREAAGRFYLADAIGLCSEGSLEDARLAILKLATVWPEGRKLVLDTGVLEPVW